MNRIALVAAAALVGLSGSAVAQTLTLGTSPQGSASYLTGASVAKVVAEATDLNPRVIPEGGSEVSLTRLNAGDLNLAIATTPPLVQAWDGGKEYRDEKQDKIRVIAVLRTLRTALMVRKDSDIQSTDDFNGKRVADGFARVRAAGQMLDAKLAAAGISKDDLVLVPEPDGGRAVEDLVSGNLDVTSFSLTSGKTREADATVGIRFITIPDSDKAKAAAQKVLPGSFIETVQPGPNYPGVTGPTNVLASYYVLVSSVEMDDDTAFEITKALYENKKALVDSYAPMAEFNPDNMHPDVDVPYHPGAMKFYEQVGK